MQKVEKLLDAYKTCEKLRDRHSKQLSEKAEKEHLKNLGDELMKQKLYEEWTKSPWARGAVDGSAFYKKRTEEINTEIKRLTTLKDFSDVTNTKSLAYWTIQNKPSLSHEEESVLFNLDMILIEKPASIEKNTQYIPNPETFFGNLEIGEKKAIRMVFGLIGSIRRFVPYIPERFFTTKNSDEITGYFNEK
ncbi:MAG: hypothetical protein V8T33_15775 [Parabacteroides distasonis]